RPPPRLDRRWERLRRRLRAAGRLPAAGDRAGRQLRRGLLAQHRSPRHPARGHPERTLDGGRPDVRPTLPMIAIAAPRPRRVLGWARDARVRRAALEAITIGLVAAFVLYVGVRAREASDLDFAFLQERAGFGIGDQW